MEVHRKKPNSFGFSGPMAHQPRGAARFLCRLLKGACLSLRKAASWAYCFAHATLGVRKRRLGVAQPVCRMEQQWWKTCMDKLWRERLSVLELSTMRWSFEDDVIRYRDHGYRAIGVWRDKLSDFGESKGRQLLDELGMSVSSLHWAGGFTGFEGRSHTESLCDALDAVHVASDLQADCLVILAGSRAGHTRSHVRRLLVSALKEIAQQAAALGVQLALEPMHSGCAQNFSFLTNIPETLEVLSSIDQSNLGIVFDCYHMAQDPRVLEWLPEITPQIRLVQCGDSKSIPNGLQNRCLLGHGRVPIAPIIQTIENSGYQGYYEVELLGEDVEEYDYDHLLETSHQTLLRLTC